VDYKLIIL